MTRSYIAHILRTFSLPHAKYKTHFRQANGFLSLSLRSRAIIFHFCLQSVFISIFQTCYRCSYCAAPRVRARVYDPVPIQGNERMPFKSARDIPFFVITLFYARFITFDGIDVIVTLLFRIKRVSNETRLTRGFGIRVSSGLVFFCCRTGNLICICTRKMDAHFIHIFERQTSTALLSPKQWKCKCERETTATSQSLFISIMFFYYGIICRCHVAHFILTVALFAVISEFFFVELKKEIYMNECIITAKRRLSKVACSNCGKASLRIRIHSTKSKARKQGIG